MGSIGNLKTRLAKLEGGAGKRTFVMWDKSACDPTFNLEAETERFCCEHGVTGQDLLVIISLFSPRRPQSL